MPLIKASQSPALGASPFSMKDIEDQARAILLRARQQAEQLLAAAQHEAERIRAQALEQGMAEGRAKGLAEGREEGLAAGREQALAEHRSALTAAVQALTTAASEVESSRLELESAARTDVLNLAVAIAERVTRRVGLLDPQAALNSVEAALAIASHASDVRIAIHPSQKAAVDEVLPRLKLQWPTLRHVEVVADESVTPGGCRLHTAAGEVDADLAGQVDRIVAELLPARSAQQEGAP